MLTLFLRGISNQPSWLAVYLTDYLCFLWDASIDIYCLGPIRQLRFVYVDFMTTAIQRRCWRCLEFSLIKRFQKQLSFVEVQMMDHCRTFRLKTVSEEKFAGLSRFQVLICSSKTYKVNARWMYTIQDWKTTTGWTFACYLKSTQNSLKNKHDEENTRFQRRSRPSPSRVQDLSFC